MIGTGYLGATHAAAMAELGFEVVGVDTDPEKVEALAAGKVPFFEPGLPELLAKHVATGRLRFTTDLAEAVGCRGRALRLRRHAAARRAARRRPARTSRRRRRVAERLTCTTGLIVGKSTVPVGTAARLRGIVARAAPGGVDAELVWNPEFLREGMAVEDTLHPDRLVWAARRARPRR